MVIRVRPTHTWAYASRNCRNWYTPRNLIFDRYADTA